MQPAILQCHIYNTRMGKYVSLGYKTVARRIGLNAVADLLLLPLQ